MSQQRFFELDALRGLAAVIVVGFHYLYRYHNIYPDGGVYLGWARFGQYGVQLFFMISGFVIFWTLERLNYPLDFIVSRFTRLYPVFWVAMVITFSVVSVAGLPGREVGLRDALFNTLMFHEYLGVPNVDGVYWSLTFELTFYFWMFIIYISNNLVNIKYLMIGWVVLAFGGALQWVRIPEIVSKVLILDYINLFAAGVCFFHLWRKHKSISTIVLLAASFLFNFVHYEAGAAVVISLWYLVFGFAISSGGGVLRQKYILYLGAISYALYLVHQNVGYIIIRTAYDVGLPGYVGVVIALVVSCLIASFLTAYVERPSSRVIKRLYQNSSVMQRLAKSSRLRHPIA